MLNRQTICFWILAIFLGWHSSSAKAAVHLSNYSSAVSDTTSETNLPDVLPQFPGGLNRFNAYLLKNWHFKQPLPSSKIVMSFIINVDGTLSDFKVLNNIGRENEAEVFRVLTLSPKWVPAKKSGKAVIFKYVIPVILEWSEP